MDGRRTTREKKGGIEKRGRKVRCKRRVTGGMATREGERGGRRRGEQREKKNMIRKEVQRKEKLVKSRRRICN